MSLLSSKNVGGNQNSYEMLNHTLKTLIILLHQKMKIFKCHGKKTFLKSIESIFLQNNYDMQRW